MKRSILSVLTGLVCISILLCSCGAKGYDAMEENAVAQDGYYITEDSYYNDAGDLEEPTSSDTDITIEADSTSKVSDNRKIIKTTELTVETKEFDNLMDLVSKEIGSLGGYIESADISGRSIDSHATRSANLTIRIPAGKDTDFLNYISDNSVITRQFIATEDVTLAYVDTESRLSALQAEKQALEKLLEEATLIEDIIALTDRLTGVIQEIESYESQLRTYDNLVDYCTVSLYIYEVEFTTVVEEQTVWQQIAENLKKNFSNVWNGIQTLFVFFVSIIPYLIPFVIIGLIVLFFIRRSIRRRKKAQEKAKEQSPSTPTQD